MMTTTPTPASEALLASDADFCTAAERAGHAMRARQHARDGRLVAVTWNVWFSPTAFDQRLRALMREVLEARERTLGAEHPDTLKTKHNLAATLQQRGDLAGAEALLQDVLQAWERTLGPEHPDTVCSKGFVATCLQDAGQYEEAVAMEEKPSHNLRSRRCPLFRFLRRSDVQSVPSAGEEPVPRRGHQHLWTLSRNTQRFPTAPGRGWERPRRRRAEL